LFFILLDWSVGLDPRGSIVQIGGQDNLQAVHHKKGVKLVDLLGLVHMIYSTEGTLEAHFPALVLCQAWTSEPS
jgi:hypothetical protein